MDAELTDREREWADTGHRVEADVPRETAEDVIRSVDARLARIEALLERYQPLLDAAERRLTKPRFGRGNGN